MAGQGVTRNVTLDRIEGANAVLLDGQAQVTVPTAWLPAGASEGNTFVLRIEAAPQAQADAAARVRDLQNQLFKKG